MLIGLKVDEPGRELQVRPLIVDRSGHCSLWFRRGRWSRDRAGGGTARLR